MISRRCCRSRSSPGICLGSPSIVAGQITSHAHGEHHAKGNVSFSDGFGSPGVCDSAFGTRWDKVEARGRAEDARIAAATPAE